MGTGRSAARRAERTAAQTQREQRFSIAQQRQKDEARLAEEEGELARRRALAKSGKAGRSLLIKTSETGAKSSNLGGTV